MLIVKNAFPNAQRIVRHFRCSSALLIHSRHRRLIIASESKVHAEKERKRKGEEGRRSRYQSSRSMIDDRSMCDCDTIYVSAVPANHRLNDLSRSDFFHEQIQFERNACFRCLNRPTALRARRR